MSSGLAVNGLVKRYGRLTAVDGLTFAVAEGEIMALVGPNGAGKTTTLLSLAGLLRPDAGTIRLGDVVLGAERGRQMALIPETPEVYSMLTVWEHLVFVARSCRLGAGWEQRGGRLLQRLAIDDRRDVLGEALSKGMRQKLLIACAVLADTPVLLLDEPMIGLDPRGQRELREILLEARAQGRIVIISTHLLEYLEGLCDSLLIVKAGRAVAAGRVADLVRQAAGRSLEDMFLEIVEAS
ncbi:MAG: ABC transporter ATP-binding protein [Candidatus Dormibacteraceae bacterium]